MNVQNLLDKWQASLSFAEDLVCWAEPNASIFFLLIDIAWAVGITDETTLETQTVCSHLAGTECAGRCGMHPGAVQRTGVLGRPKCQRFLPAHRHSMGPGYSSTGTAHRDIFPPLLDGEHPPWNKSLTGRDSRYVEVLHSQDHLLWMTVLTCLLAISAVEPE